MLTDLPKVLTLSRIAAIPLLVVLVALGTPAGALAACVVFSAAAITKTGSELTSEMSPKGHRVG